MASQDDASAHATDEENEHDDLYRDALK